MSGEGGGCGGETVLARGNSVQKGTDTKENIVHLGNHKLLFYD